MNFIDIAQAGVITDAPSVSNIGMNVLYFFLSIAGILAIISLVIAGVRYFLAVGDEQAVEHAKKMAQSAILGIVFSMGGMIVVKLIGQFIVG